MPELPQDDTEKKDLLKKYKGFRKYNTKNTDKYFHTKLWTVTDPALAEQLGISMAEETHGDIWMVRQSTMYNGFQKNIKLAGFDFESRKVAV
jgi:hypothetical protein